MSQEKNNFLTKETNFQNYDNSMINRYSIQNKDLNRENPFGPNYQNFENSIQPPTEKDNITPNSRSIINSSIKSTDEKTDGSINGITCNNSEKELEKIMKSMTLIIFLL